MRTILIKLFYLSFILIIGQQCTGVKTGNSSLEINYDSLTTVLESVYDRDQGIRRTLADSIGYDSPQAPEYFSRMRKIDDENQEILLPILEKYGWIPRSKIGEKASGAIFLAIQYSDITFRDKYFPQLDSLAKVGEANKSDAAMMEDRLLMDKRLKQKYGTQVIQLEAGRTVWPIAEPDKVDSLRKAVGFELSVYENAQRLNAVYDPELALPVDLHDQSQLKKNE